MRAATLQRRLIALLDRVQAELIWRDPRITEACNLLTSTDKHDHARIIRLARSVVGCPCVTFNRSDNRRLDGALTEVAELVPQLEAARGLISNHKQKDAA